MPLQNINPTTTKAWEKLESHYSEMSSFSLKTAFKTNPERKEKFSLDFNDLHLDFSKNKVNQKTVDLLVELANEVELKDAINKYFTGDIINENEDRAVLHTALRSNSEDELFVDNKNIKPEIKKALRKIRAFSNKVISGDWKGYTGKKITDVVNIGIGGSDLGPDMVV
jgi:glucose-6-phosphate isomerase